MELNQVRRILIRFAVCVGCFIGVLTLRIPFPVKLLLQSVALYFLYPAFLHCGKEKRLRKIKKSIKIFMLISATVAFLNGLGIIESTGTVLEGIAYVAGASLLSSFCFSWQKYDEKQKLESVLRAAYRRYTLESWEALPYEQFKESNLLTSKEQRMVSEIEASGYVDPY